MADSYVKDAFLMPQNLVAVGGATVATLAFFPTLFLGVMAAEGVYLWMMSSNPRFQRLIRSRRR